MLHALVASVALAYQNEGQGRSAHTENVLNIHAQYKLSSSLESVPLLEGKPYPHMGGAERSVSFSTGCLLQNTW